MSDLAIEVFREDTDNLSKALMAVVRDHVGAMPYTDRSIIVAAALANIACWVDIEQEPYTADCTAALKRCTVSWTWRG